MSPSRIKAIEILLRKSIPDLQSVELSGPEGGAVQVERIERVIVRPT